MKQQRCVLPYLPILLILGGFDAPSAVAADIDWASVEAKTIKVFYPGVASWEFMKDKDHGAGAPPVETFKKACAECHVSKAGEYDINADKIIAGSLQKAKSKDPLEPEPLSGMPGFKDVQVQAAYDAENVYLRLQWQGSGASVADPSLAKDDKADRISVQLNENIKSFQNYGCFITCHDDETGMPGNRGEEVTLYGYYTHEKDGSVKAQDKLAEHLTKAQFMDLWVVAFEGAEVKATDEYVLEKRSKDDQNDLSATGGFEGGKYTVVVKRKLSTGDAKDVAVGDGKAFSVGFSVHDNKNKGRKHYVSFPVSIGLSSPGDIAAKKF